MTNQERIKEYFYEYQEIPSSNENLIKHIKKNIPLHKYFKEDWGKIKTRQYCGILNFEDEDYYILPRIANKDSKNIDIFIYMLMYAYDIKLSNKQIASCQNENHTILEVFVQMFAQNILNEVKKGLYKEYITKQENLTILKGKYLINENLKYNFTKNKIYCEYDEFSANNTLNQFFLYAIKELQKYVKDKKLLKQCELIFDEVDSIKIDINRVNIYFNRLNQRFKISFEIALLLLQKTIPLFLKGEKSFAFLFDMNILFEKFIAKIINEIEKDVSIPKVYKEFGALKLKPDIIVKSKNLIIDCKYKKIDMKKIDRNDKYQMYAYGNNFEDIKSTMLLYPKNLNEDIQIDISERYYLGDNNKKVELKIKKIDLSFNGKYIEYINEIKKKMKKILEDGV